MLTRRDREKFERITMPHLDAAYNLALWIMKDSAEAEDVVQTAYMKAFENFLRFQGENYTAWLLTIVRNTAFNLLKKKRTGNLVSFDEKLHSQNPHNKADHSSYSFHQPDDVLAFSSVNVDIKAALEQLGAEQREALFLRELEGYSYKEIAEITEVSIGTVMSRLSRARENLRKHYVKNVNQERSREL